MQSPCIREASQACFHGCCLNPFFGLPEPLNSSPKQGTPNPRYNFISATALLLYPNTHFTNHESLPSLSRSFSNLNKAYIKYTDTDQADEIRTREYYHLSVSNHVCLDYTGHCLFSYSQQFHRSAPFFNISYKSINLNSAISHGGLETEFESMVKKRIMRFMNISTDDYNLVLTANQLSAFKLLADSYSFQTNRNLLTAYDHENEAVEAMVDSSRKRGAKVMSAEFSWPNMRIQSRKLRKMVITKKKKKKRGLFVFPLQSKVTGARYSYLWMSVAQENGWHVCLDASALGAKDMETLGLSLFQPDFLICSFYKVFGENPSGFGCFFVKKSRTSVLSNAGTSLGVVSLVPAPKQSLFLENSTFADTEHEAPSLESKKADIDMASSSSSSSISDQQEIQEIEEISTKQRQLSLSEIIKLERSFTNTQSKTTEASGSGSSETEFRGLDHADSMGLILMSSRARYLVNWLVNALTSLQHPHSENGLPLVRIYGPKVRLDRGPAVAFNVFDWKGEKVDPTLVQKLADRNNISLSYATLKHIVFSDKNHEERERLMEAKSSYEEGNLVKVKREKLDISIPVITASLGFLTNFEDTYRLWAFVSRFLDADFVEKERWRYMALNRTTVEV